MPFSAAVNGKMCRFPDLRTVMAKANEEKSGDQLAGIAAADARERMAAKRALADVRLRTFVNEPLLSPEADELSRSFMEGLDTERFVPIADWSVGEFREHLLADDPAALAVLRPALLPEIAAAVAKLMSNLDLMLAAKRLPVVVHARTTLGLPGRLATRLQPNHPRCAQDV
jgi:ethanolamine ammonia-lyase large subunit